MRSILVLITAAGILGAARAAGTEATVEAVWRGRAPRPGATVTVAVRIEGASAVGSVPFTLLYDPAILEYLPSRSEEGAFLRRDGSSTSFLAAPSAAPPRRAAVVVGLSRLGADAGAHGRGVLCRLTFRARAPGVSPLTFARGSVLDPEAHPVPSRFRDGWVTVRPPR